MSKVLTIAAGAALALGLTLGLAACGHNVEEKAATGAAAGAVVAGPVGAVVGAGVGTVMGHTEKKKR